MPPSRGGCRVSREWPDLGLSRRAVDLTEQTRPRLATVSSQQRAVMRHCACAHRLTAVALHVSTTAHSQPTTHLSSTSSFAQTRQIRCGDHSDTERQPPSLRRRLAFCEPAPRARLCSRMMRSAAEKTAG